MVRQSGINGIILVAGILIAPLVLCDDVKPVTLRSVYKMSPASTSLGIGLAVGSNGSIEDRRHYFVPDFYDHGFTIIGPDACSEEPKSYCSFSRGQIFWGNLTEEQTSFHDLHVRKQLSIFHGHPWRNTSFELGAISSSGSISVQDHDGTAWKLDKQAMRKISGSDPWTGTIGLATSISLTTVPKKRSFLEDFNDQYTLPSLSWSYTFNTLNGVEKSEGRTSPYFFPDIVLGGYDEERCDFAGNKSINYSFSTSKSEPNYYRIPEVHTGIVNKEGNRFFNWTANHVILDPVAPYIWLPKSISDSIAEILNAHWDSHSGLYVIQEGGRENWTSNALQLYFDVEKSLEETITLKAAVSDLHPITVHYFDNGKDTKISYLPISPLPQGVSQIVFGKPFFQTTCIMVNHETSQYQLMPRSQHHEMKSNPGTFRAIKSINPKPKSKGSSSSSETTRLVLEIIFGILAVFLILFLFFWGRRRRAQAKGVVIVQSPVYEKDGSTRYELETSPVYEVEGLTALETGTGSSLDRNLKSEPTPPSDNRSPLDLRSPTDLVSPIDPRSPGESRPPAQFGATLGPIPRTI